MRQRRFLVLTFTMVLGGCFKGDDSNQQTTADETDTTGCPVGSETCPCTLGGSCDVGLQCLSDVCVDPTGDGDGDLTGDGDGDGTGDGDGDGDPTGDGDGDGPTMHECDPLLQDCTANDHCIFASMYFVCLPNQGDFPLGEPCSEPAECITGTDCFPAAALPQCGGTSCCASYCDLTDPTCPQRGTECTAFFDEGQAPPGFESVGVCLAPGA